MILAKNAKMKKERIHRVNWISGSNQSYLKVESQLFLKSISLTKFRARPCCVPCIGIYFCQKSVPLPKQHFLYKKARPRGLPSAVGIGSIRRSDKTGFVIRSLHYGSLLVVVSISPVLTLPPNGGTFFLRGILYQP